MNQLFIGSKLKIERANKHIADLNTLRKAFNDSDFCRVVNEPDPNTGSQILQINITQLLPTEAGLIVGDAVHNLHTALDLMMYKIAPDRDTKFPFFEKRQELIGQINRGKIQTAGPEICDLIINRIKPYRGGNDALYGLHTLDIRDKHRVLILMSGVLLIDNINTEDQDGNVLPINLIQRLKTGKFFFAIGGVSLGARSMDAASATSRVFKIKGYEAPTVEILFGKRQPFEGEPVIETLYQLSQLVSGIVQTIEQKFIARIGA